MDAVARYERSMSFQSLSLGDLHLGLRDLLSTRIPTVGTVHTLRVYEPRLRAQLTSIESLPGITSSAEPFAKELAATDVTHDAHGGAVWYVIEACLRSPLVDDALKATLRDARQKIIPELSELKLPYADEAAKAIGRASELAALKVSLTKVDVPGGKTLYDWCAAFVAAGGDLDELLRKRADAGAGDRKGAGTLRGATVGLLNRFRAALADELADDPDGLAKVDRALFAYLDELESRRAGRAAPASDEPARREPKPDATPVTPA